jgi:hypothetical protein
MLAAYLCGQPSPDPNPPLLRSTYGETPKENLSIAFQAKFDADFEKISPKSKTSGIIYSESLKYAVLHIFKVCDFS